MVRPADVAELLAALDSVSHETTVAVNVLDQDEGTLEASDRREAKRRILEIRARAQELFDWLSAIRVGEKSN